MAYRVVEMFTDLQDNNYKYEVGSTFPRKGKRVTKKRLQELSTVNNKRKTILIEEIEDKEE